MKRIICLGNPLFASDDAGPRVFEVLSSRVLPEGVEVIDGGVVGLGLLRLLEGARRVVFVDSAEGMAHVGSGVVTLDPARVAALATGGFDHAAGLPYLLKAVPLALDTPPPSIAIVAIQGEHDHATIERAADLALRLVVEHSTVVGAEVAP